MTQEQLLQKWQDANPDCILVPIGNQPTFEDFLRFKHASKKLATSQQEGQEA